MLWLAQVMASKSMHFDIYRRERGFFDICIPGVRLNNGSNVGPTSLLQMLIRERGRGEDRHYYGLR